MIDICCIGHITHDHIITPNENVHQPGGATYYFSHAINNMEKSTLSYRLITSVAEPDFHVIDELKAAGIDVVNIPSKNTVFFENKYGEDLNERAQRVMAKADPFTLDKVKDVEARYIVLGSLLADDFPLEVMAELSRRGILVVDAQGFLREVRGEKVYACDWQNKKEALQYVDILKVNEHEIQTITGRDFKDSLSLHDMMKDGCMMLADLGVKEILLTLGGDGSLVYADGHFHKIPPYQPRCIVDTTGCGDTYVMGYVYKRAQGVDPFAAGCFAGAVSTLKLEHLGPFYDTEKDALALLKRKA